MSMEWYKVCDSKLIPTCEDEKFNSVSGSILDSSDSELNSHLKLQHVNSILWNIQHISISQHFIWYWQG